MTAEHDGPEPRRVNYFNGQFLQEQDFRAEQNYHIAQRRRLTRLTRGAGIVSGLEVKVTSAKDGQLTVAAGLAVDGDGNLLVLPEKRPVTVEDPGVATGFLLIEYGDQGDRLVAVGGGQATRQVERPVIRFAPDNDAPPASKGVRLARLKLDGKKISPLEASGEALDLSVRHAAGLDLGGDLAVRGAATVGDPGRPRPLSVHGPLSADEAITGASLIAATGGLTVQAGGLTVEQGQAQLKDGLSVQAGGLTIEQGQAQLKDGLSVSGGATITAGGLAVEQGQAQLKDGLSVSGAPAVLNSQMLRIKGGDDANHGIVFNSAIDGPEFRAYQGFLWKNGTAGATERMRLDAGGNLSLGGALKFGETTRQMLNLWGAIHGIGVQNGTTYFRSSNHFGWYKGGEHSDTSLAAGTGGTALMSLGGDGKLTVEGALQAGGFAVHRLASILQHKTSLPATEANWRPIPGLSLEFSIRLPNVTPLLISYQVVAYNAPGTAFLVTRIKLNDDESVTSRCHSQPGKELSNHGLSMAWSSTERVKVVVEYRSNGALELLPDKLSDWMTGTLQVLVLGKVTS